MWGAKFSLLAPFHPKARTLGATKVCTPLCDEVDHSVCSMPGAKHSRFGAHRTVRWRFSAAFLGTRLINVIYHPFEGMPGAENSTSAFFVTEHRPFDAFIVGALGAEDGNHSRNHMLGAHPLSSDPCEHEGGGFRAAFATTLLSLIHI